MKGILEPRQRQSALYKLLVGNPNGAAWWIHEWLVRSGSGDPAVHVALDTLAVVLTRPGLVGYDDRAQLYSSAKEAQLDHVAFLMLEEISDQGDFEEERPLQGDQKPLTLGERKSLARGSQRDILQKLAADPHPDVVSILLMNPKLTEREVLRITSRRPVAAATLLQVVLNERFRPRHPVRRSLCLNPYTPATVAARLMANLGNRDLRDVGSNRNRPVQLRLHAKAVLDLRADSPTSQTATRSESTRLARD